MKNRVSITLLIVCSFVWGCGDHKIERTWEGPIPSDNFDLSNWRIDLPIDEDGDGRVDKISRSNIQNYQHSDFFYLDSDGQMVFTAPNKAITTVNSSNSRSELLNLLGDGSKKGVVESNYFSLKSNSRSTLFAQTGGKLRATLKVNHVAKRAGHSDKFPAYSVVIGQIHAAKVKQIRDKGFGWGNEPIKIYYKKWPNHDYGSVFWNYERNLAKNDEKRKDISLPVWGNTWENPLPPGKEGVALGEEFTYQINVYDNTMYLTFESPRHETIKYEINLSKNFDALDHPKGYSEDSLYFKAGAYNQCSTKDAPGVWYTKCLGTGNWGVDKANGDYAQVAFSQLVSSIGSKP